MKLFIKLMISVLVIGILLPFTILKGTDGKPLLSFTDLKSPELPKVSGSITGLGGESSDNKDAIYKWVDENGDLQFSNSPPPAGIEHTIMNYDPNLNVIQAVEVKSNEPAEVLESEPKEEATSVKDVGNPYSPEKIEKLFEDANNIEKLLTQRLNNQEAIIGQ